MYYYFGSGFQPGDHLQVTRAGSAVKHQGLHWGIDASGEYVIHSEKGRGVVVTTFDEFVNGGVVELVYRPATPEEVLDTLAEAGVQLGKPYDVLRANCEHFVTQAQSGVPTSSTLGKAVAAGILAWLFWPRGDD